MRINSNFLNPFQEFIDLHKFKTKRTFQKVSLERNRELIKVIENTVKESIGSNDGFKNRKRVWTTG